MDKISNWRYDLREVEGVPEDISNSKPTTDLKSKREVKEKTVNNKVTINPPLGDKMEGVIASMGGKLISISEEEIETEVDSKTKIKEGVLGSPGTKKLRSASDRSKNSMTDKDRKKQENIRKGRDILNDIQGTQKALDHDVSIDRRIARSKIKKEGYQRNPEKGEEGKCDGCTCKGCGPGGVGHQNPCVECGGHHKDKLDEVRITILDDKKKKEDLDKYDRHKRMIRHKQDKYGKNIIGADYNLENERKAKGWKKKLNKEETEVKEATYPGHDEKGNPLKPKDNRYRVSNADKKANTPAWQKYKSGDKRYTKLDHVDEGYVDKKKSEVIKALTKKKDKFVKKYGKDAPDVMYAVAAKTAKKKGDTSKSDDRYAYEEVQLEGFKEDEIETMRAQHKAREEQKKKLPQYKPVPLKRSGKNTSSDSDRDRLAKSVRGENIPGFKGGRLD